MIYFHACKGFTFTMNSTVRSWAKHLIDRIVSVPYSALDPREPIPAGLHIFTDFERLRPSEMRFVHTLVDRMAQHPESYAMVNDPATWTGRLGLNQALSAEGINDYRAFAADQVPADLKFPAFVRYANEHSGSLAEPVHSHDEIRRLIRTHAPTPLHRARRNLLVVEQLDARSPDGVFRKYGAIKIGDRMFAKHICFSRNWVTKDPTIVDPEFVAEEQRYLESLPHTEELNQAFKLAGLDYGRIDYGIVNGRIQVWEINTNPVVASRRQTVEPERLASQEAAIAPIMQWLEQLADSAPRGPDVRLFSRIEAPAATAWVRLNARHDARRK